MLGQKKYQLNEWISAEISAASENQEEAKCRFNSSRTRTERAKANTCHSGIMKKGQIMQKKKSAILG